MKNLFWKFIFFIHGFKFYPYGGGDGDDKPEAPAFQLPSYAQGLPEEQLALIRARIGKTAGTPQEFDIASQALQGLLGTQASQFQFPREAIQQALDAQQAQELQRYQQQVNPLLAQRGQFDSSTRENLLTDFLGYQSTARLGTTADLLTQEAQQNLQLQQFIPQFQSGIAGQLAGLGGQRSALDQFNLTLPFQTTIPGLGNVYNQGLALGDRDIAQQNLQFQADLQDYQQKQAQQSQLFSQLGQLGAAGLTGGLSGLAPGGAGFFGGTLQGLQGTAGTAQLLSQFPGLSGQGVTPNYQYRPNLSQQSQILGFDTRAFQ